MFGMSLPELTIVIVLGLIVFGPNRIPKIARTVGKVVREMRRTAAEVQRTIDIEDLRNDLRLRNLMRTDSKPSSRETETRSTSQGSKKPKRREKTQEGTSPAPEKEVLPDLQDASIPASDSGATGEDARLEAALRKYLAQGRTSATPRRTLDLAPSAGAVGEATRIVALPQRIGVNENKLREVQLPTVASK